MCTVGTKDYDPLSIPPECETEIFGEGEGLLKIPFQLIVHEQLRRTGFNCENVLIANCEFLLSSQLLEMQEQSYTINNYHHRYSAPDHTENLFRHNVRT